MKLRKDKDIMRFLGIGLVMALLGAATLRFHTLSKAVSLAGGSLILAGLIMFIMALYSATKPKTDLIVDERVAGINERAGYAAFWMVLLSMTVIFWADKFWSFHLELKDMYTITLLIGMYSWLIFRWYYNKKSDI